MGQMEDVRRSLSFNDLIALAPNALDWNATAERGTAIREVLIMKDIFIFLVLVFVLLYVHISAPIPRLPAQLASSNSLDDSIGN